MEFGFIWLWIFRWFQWQYSSAYEGLLKQTCFYVTRSILLSVSMFAGSRRPVLTFSAVHCSQQEYTASTNEALNKLRLCISQEHHLLCDSVTLVNMLQNYFCLLRPFEIADRI